MLRRRAIQQIKRLEDEADFLVADTCEIAISEIRDELAVQFVAQPVVRREAVLAAGQRSERDERAVGDAETRAW